MAGGATLRVRRISSVFSPSAIGRRTPGSTATSYSSSTKPSNRRLCTVCRGAGPPPAALALASRAGSDVQPSGKNRRKATGTGTSPDDSVSETSVWQLALTALRSSTQCGGVLGRDTDRGAALLRQRRVIDDAAGVSPADQP